ncbi:MAG: S-methyl-5-thioribose-1-phosphate isomerase [Spirochaetales bacterium]|nr:S-methyl-5-thioribose-1-phosphate isomerase [Spirochaetales bacterium]
MIHLPFLLTEDGICRLEEGCLSILDRRRFPFERVEVPCRSAEEVASALKAMVTQGGGPLEVALKTMIMEARNHERLSSPDQIRHLEQVVRLLSSARPTNTTMARSLDEVLVEVEKRRDEPPSKVVEEAVRTILDRFAETYHRIGRLGSTLIDDGDQILTTCFAEHTFLLSLLYAKQAGKRVRVLVSETRPYLQGSRLAAPSLQEAGIPVRVITDGMGPTMIATGAVQVYMTAADLVCRDGTVVNKIGTLSNALACARYGIPYYALAISPDPTRKTRADVTIETRDPKEVTECMGTRTTLDTIEGVYPAFDIVDPRLVTRIITPNGILKPDELEEHGR